ncbi:hypothetical protein D4764_10G0011250 [Takifugu flavidus]|uniref:Uncharacterized protein n=1 Tax=Takifugu flavidus TaxID=433684 RepID=A0A5C6PKX1_9TELE|nr:hypothetical protein D4764_10G0011250 [Takifugu flavidus]
MAAVEDVGGYEFSMGSVASSSLGCEGKGQQEANQRTVLLHPDVAEDGRGSSLDVLKTQHDWLQTSLLYPRPSHTSPSPCQRFMAKAMEEVKSPLPKKTSMQAAGVSLQQFHTCPPPPLREGRVSLPIALPLSDGAPVCQQSECGAERSVTHRQTVRVRDTEDLRGVSGTAGVDERSDESDRAPLYLCHIPSRSCTPRHVRSTMSETAQTRTFPQMGGAKMLVSLCLQAPPEFFSL